MPVYNFKYSENNVYGHVVKLLKGNIMTTDGIHLDIGCGYGNIAEHIEKLGLKYIGVDGESKGIENIKGRSITGYHHTFGNIEEDEKYLREITKGQKISSISVIDMLEHITFGEDFLSLLHKLAFENNALLLLSVPNVAHNDIALKLLTGDFDYTETGLLDNSHVKLFTEKSLRTLTKKVGFREVDSLDIKMEKSDQFFPENHAFLSEGSNLVQFIKDIRINACPFATTNQFVRAYLPFDFSKSDCLERKSSEKAPFLSIITRTQGKRIDELREMLLCLCGQECEDFELLIVGHKLDIKQQIDVEKLIDETPNYLKQKISFISVDHGTRTTPLNVGFENAKGDYVSILDDDDIVFSNWVSTFKELSHRKKGAVLRAACVAQCWERVQTKFNEIAAVRACGEPIKYSSEFNYLEHLKLNYSPLMSLAFPRFTFDTLNIKFDEEMTTTEDWDFLLRCAPVCGVANSTKITSIYKHWKGAENSIFVHDKNEWLRNETVIYSKIDRTYLLLPPGSASQIKELIELQQNVSSSSGKNTQVLARLYIDDGEGMNEEKTINKNTPAEGKIEITFSNFYRYKEIREVRFDPCIEGLVSVYDFKAKILYQDGSEKVFETNNLHTNGITHHNGIHFVVDDPQFFNIKIKKPILAINFKYTIKDLDRELVQSLCKGE